MLAVVLSKNARARAVQLPAWNEALGLPRPWDQQWSLRLQQILAYETDLLEYGDIFDGSAEIARKVAALKAEAMAELRQHRGMGGAVTAVERGYMKQQLVESNTRGVEAIERGEQIVVGVNRFTETEPSPLPTRRDGAHVVRRRPSRAGRAARGLARSRATAGGRRGAGGVAQAAASGATSCRPRSICANAGVTTGEWGGALRAVFGEYRAPTGVGTAMRNDADDLDDIRAEVDRVSAKLGRRLKMLVGKPGLDGHSNGAEQIAVRARDAGMEVVYDGIRLTPRRSSRRAEKGVHVVGLSILSGSHLPLVHDVMARMKAAGLDVPVVVGGIIPPEDASALKERRRRGLHAEGFRIEPDHERSLPDRGRRGGRRGVTVSARPRESGDPVRYLDFRFRGNERIVGRYFLSDCVAITAAMASPSALGLTGLRR